MRIATRLNRIALKLTLKKAYSLVAPQVVPLEENTAKVVLHAPDSTPYPVAMRDAKFLLGEVHRDLKQFGEFLFQIKLPKEVTIGGQHLLEVEADLKYAEGEDSLDLNHLVLRAVRKHAPRHDFYH